MVKITLTIEQTPQGHIALDLASDGLAEASGLEQRYAFAFKDIFQKAITPVGLSLGAKAAIVSEGKLSNQ